MQNSHCMPDQSSAATEHAILQEITAPLDTLPDDPVAAVNADFPAALRGYERLAVDAYVQRTSQLVAELQATRSPDAAVRKALERVGEQISGILQRAHETAEQITAQSRREAEDRLEQARAEAAEIANLAQQRVKDLDADTDRIWIERHRIVDDARDLAGQLLALAQTAADSFSEAEDATAPYGVEDKLPAEATGDGDASDADYEEESDYEQAGHEPERGADELGATVAFGPLEPEDPGEPEDASEAEDEGQAEHEGQAEQDQEPPLPPEGGSSRSLIPPASQAANRRSPR
jgi:cell division septum initiation protein DivIVA